MVQRWIRDLVSPRWRKRLRRLDRLRWLAKMRVAWDYGRPLWRHPLRTARYVILDPELESFTYELKNVDELTAFVAGFLGSETERIAEYGREVDADPMLRAELARRVRWRFDMKRRLPLANRLLWYVLVRATRPWVVVESGIYHGLGSVVLLRALERNRAEGHPGRLVSFDIDPDSGWLVPDSMRAHWMRVIGPTQETFRRVVAATSVDLFIHDTPGTAENQLLEFPTVLDHAGPRLVIVDSSGLGRLRQLVHERGGVHARFNERSKDHIYPGRPIGVALLDRSAASPTTPTE